MLDLMAAASAADQIDKSIGIIAKVVGKLKTQPDLAAQKLAQALGEVSKTLQVVDNAAAEYLSLGIDDGALAKNSKLLLQIDGGSMAAEVQRGRGHCHLILQIYETYLNRWFSKVLNTTEYDEVRQVFVRLGDADGNLFHELERVATMLQAEAGGALDLVVKGDEAAARQRVLSSLSALRPLRKTISGTMQTIYMLQGEFVDIAGAV